MYSSRPNMRKACVNGFSREEHERWFWSKIYKSFLIFFFLARIVPIDRRIKKKHQRGWSNQDLFDLFLPRESYIENYYFLCSCVRINHFDSLLIAKNMSNLFWKKKIVVVKLYVETWIHDAISISTKGNLET